MANVVQSADLKLIVEKIERGLDEKTAAMEHINNLFTEAKSKGYDVKALKQIIRLRQKNQQELAEEEEIIEIYKRALGMI